MAHELLIDRDGRASMFYVGAVPWHELGQRLQGPPTAEEAIRTAGLDWEVAKAPLFYHWSIEETAIVPNRFALVPGRGWPHEERPLFGVVTSAYEVLQNTSAFGFFDPLVRKGYARYETAGALGKGERVWVLARLRGDFDVRSGDRIERYLLLSNTHDGHSAAQVRFTPIRVVCQNTLSMALEDAGEVFSVRHDPALFDNLGAVADETMDRIEARYDAVEKAFARMLDVPMDGDALAGYFERVFPDPESPAEEGWGESFRRRQREARVNREVCAKLFDEGEHCRLAGANLWGAYNAVTEFVDRWRPDGSRGRTPAGQLSRIWFGGGYRAKVRAFEEAMRLLRN